MALTFKPGDDLWSTFPWVERPHPQADLIKFSSLPWLELTEQPGNRPFDCVYNLFSQSTAHCFHVARHCFSLPLQIHQLQIKFWEVPRVTVRTGDDQKYSTAITGRDLQEISPEESHFCFFIHIYTQEDCKNCHVSMPPTTLWAPLHVQGTFGGQLHAILQPLTPPCSEICSLLLTFDIPKVISELQATWILLAGHGLKFLICGIKQRNAKNCLCKPDFRESANIWRNHLNKAWWNCFFTLVQLYSSRGEGPSATPHALPDFPSFQQ